MKILEDNSGMCIHALEAASSYPLTDTYLAPASLAKYQCDRAGRVNPSQVAKAQRNDLWLGAGGCLQSG